MSKLAVVVTSMSSLEIAELTGKRHDHVMNDIRKMLEELEVLTPVFSGMRKVRGKEYEVFNLPKRETLILVSGYSVSMRTITLSRMGRAFFYFNLCYIVSNKLRARQ